MYKYAKSSKRHRYYDRILHKSIEHGKILVCNMHISGLHQPSKYISEHTHHSIQNTNPARQYRGVSSAMQTSKETKLRLPEREKSKHQRVSGSERKARKSAYAPDSVQYCVEDDLCVPGGEIKRQRFLRSSDHSKHQH